MTQQEKIEYLTIKGFKSFRNLDKFQVNALNIFIGANGCGKSNFISFFRLLREMQAERLQNWTRYQGSADRVVSFGVKETSCIEVFLEFSSCAYDFALHPAVDGSFSFSRENLRIFPDSSESQRQKEIALGSGHLESRLFDSSYLSNDVRDEMPIKAWNPSIFHFHDTSDTAGVKRLCSLHDSTYLRQDGSNLAAFLFHLQSHFPNSYQRIRKIIKLSIPFFDDFVLIPQELSTGEEQIRLLWRQMDSDYVLWPSQLSDGALRFMCLVTALEQPELAQTLVFDEPELGLHPFAISLLGGLLRAASTRAQVIVSTQSVKLVNEFSVSDLVITEINGGETCLRRLEEKSVQNWLDEYTLGELWEKNILGGRPGK